MQATGEGFPEHGTEDVLHICQYGLREGGGLSTPSQQALHYKPRPDDCFLAVFFHPALWSIIGRARLKLCSGESLVRVVQNRWEVS